MGSSEQKFRVRRTEIRIAPRENMQELIEVARRIDAARDIEILEMLGLVERRTKN